MADDEVAGLVCDNGSGMAKAGFAYSARPSMASMSPALLHVFGPTACVGVLCLALDLRAPFATLALLLTFLPAACMLRKCMLIENQASDGANRGSRDMQTALARLPTNAYLKQLYLSIVMQFMACSASTFAVLLLLVGRERHESSCSRPLSQLFVIMLAWSASNLTFACKRAYDNPKSLRELLRLLFTGCSKNEIMISYCWGEGHGLAGAPRELGSILPAHAAWIDVRRLMPGDNTREATACAARDAKLRFVFLSSAYMRSPACQIELAEILAAPRDEALFIPLEQGFRVADYEAFKGVALQELLVTEPISPATVDAAWLVTQLVRTGLMRAFLRRHTPAINERWKETAEAVLGRVDLWAVFVRRCSSVTLTVLGTVAFALTMQVCAKTTSTASYPHTPSPSPWPFLPPLWPFTAVR